MTKVAFDKLELGPKQVDHSGSRFGKWRVLGFAGRRDYNPKCYAYFWRCECDCGTEEYVMGASLTKGRSTQCMKCARREPPKEGHKKVGAKKKWNLLRGLFNRENA